MYQTICSFENLLASYKKARRCIRYGENVLKFTQDLERNLLRLEYELKWERYWPSPYVYFTVHDPKERHIAAPAFRDRVVHHSLISVIEPLFEKQFITDSYACRKNKGTHFALRRIKKFLQAARSTYGSDTPLYCLRMDISKFFTHIDWNVLQDIVFKTVECPQTRKLITRIISHHRIYNHTQVPAHTIVSSFHQTGLPIGNLTSQLFANVYMNQLDQFAKKECQVAWYGRYMDDFYIIHPDKQYLWKLQKDIQTFLQDVLKLTLSKRKIVLSNVKDGVPFVGYRVFHDHVLIRADTLLHMERKLKKRRKQFASGLLDADHYHSSAASILGHFSHADSWNLQNKLALWR